MSDAASENLRQLSALLHQAAETHHQVFASTGRFLRGALDATLVRKQISVLATVLRRRGPATVDA